MTPEEVEAALQPVLDQVTEEYLRPALLAAGIEDPSRYKLALGEPEPGPSVIDLYPEVTDGP